VRNLSVFALAAIKYSLERDFCVLEAFALKFEFLLLLESLDDVFVQLRVLFGNVEKMEVYR
jgi:hypothetical protein